jgi:hypothetical protein
VFARNKRVAKERIEAAKGGKSQRPVRKPVVPR